MRQSDRVVISFVFLMLVIVLFGVIVAQHQQGNRIEALQGQVDSLVDRPPIQIGAPGTAYIIREDPQIPARLDSLELIWGEFDKLRVRMFELDRNIRLIPSQVIPQAMPEIEKRTHDLEMQVKTILEMSR